jgi:light-regulated signal transduction histidine kinase (bacteriophytochrome)
MLNVLIIEDEQLAAERMQELILDLLDYSTVGTEDNSRTKFDTRHFIDMAIDNLRSPILERAAEIDYKGDFPEIYANPQRFLRLMQNLIGNGIKYQSPDNHPIITVRAEDRGSEWLFSVRDNGIGMRQDYLNKIFEIFTRLHNKNEYSGTGIGLSVCKKIVEGEGGKIWAESAPGEGSCFFFTIPKNLPTPTYKKEIHHETHSNYAG